MNASMGHVAPITSYHNAIYGEVPFSAAVFSGTIEDWSLGPLQWPRDAAAHPELSRHVASAVIGLGGKRIFAPNPVSQNGAIITPSKLDRHIDLGGIIMRRNQAVPADGTFLIKRNDAGVFSAGGCGMIVVSYGSYLLFAHAGRESVLDRVAIASYGIERGRNELSVVNSMMNALAISHSSAREVFVWPLFGLRAEEFAHHFENKEHGKYNGALADYLSKHHGKAAASQDSSAVYLDLPQIIRDQFMRLGVPAENICMDSAYVPSGVPHTRNGGGTRRYLVAVVRNA